LVSYHNAIRFHNQEEPSPPWKSENSHWNWIINKSVISKFAIDSSKWTCRLVQPNDRPHDVIMKMKASANKRPLWGCYLCISSSVDQLKVGCTDISSFHALSISVLPSGQHSSVTIQMTQIFLKSCHEKCRCNRSRGFLGFCTVYCSGWMQHTTLSLLLICPLLVLHAHQHWRWMQQGPPKRWYPTTTLYCTARQKTTCTFTAVKTSNHGYWSVCH